jgi:hypothetical protein
MPALRFRADGTFKILQLSDVQDGPEPNPRTLRAMAALLDSEKPDLVVLTGDTVDTNLCETADDIRTAIRRIVEPMESRGIPWAHVMGNHDVDGLARIGVAKRRMMDMYRRHEFNVNPPDPRGIDGAGNGLLEVRRSIGEQSALGVWLLDSNAYAPEHAGGQELGGYDWIRASQVAWYQATSRSMERRLGGKLPSLMFFHVCLPEFAEMWASTTTLGERNEAECPARINGGLFAAALDRGDVLGIYVGHDHVNTYEGSWYGIRLGFGGSIGYASYGLDADGPAGRDRLRGGRVFTIRESDPWAFETRYLLAATGQLGN